MDKKYTIIGILFIAAAIGLYIFGPKARPPVPLPEQPAASTEAPLPAGQAPEQSVAPAPEGAAVPLPQNEPAAAAAPNSSVPAAAAAAAWINGLFAPIEPQHPDEEFAELHNEFVAVRLTNYGGAIASVALKNHPRTKKSEEPLVLNHVHHAPALAFSQWGGADFASKYTQVSASREEVVYRTEIGGQLEVTRRYRISHDPEQQDPYVIHSETTLRNLTSSAYALPTRFAINLGTGELVHDTDNPTMLSVGRYDGGKLRQTPRSALDESSGFLGLFGAHPAIPYLQNEGPTAWATVENQFFATIVTPDQPGIGVSARRIELPRAEDSAKPRFGLVGEMLLAPRTLAPSGQETLTFDVYAGPKEYKRLVRLEHEQEEVMGWGFFGAIAKILVIVLTALHNVVGNWGVAIVATTITLRVILWPLTGIQTRAAKRMAKISGPLKELQEKYKDNRQKLTEETMKLWKTHKVNPLAGCMPLLVQMPIFIGLFSMLRSAAELRFAEFLWISDLSAPDTIARIPLGFMTLPINPMVLLWGLSTHIQMRLSPTPSTDNTQAKVMKFMPVVMVVMFYGFSSGLSLYWTASNLFTIFQQWVTNRQKDPVEAAPAVAGGKGGAAERAKPVRDAKVTSVRPAKKKR